MTVKENMLSVIRRGGNCAGTDITCHLCLMKNFEKAICATNGDIGQEKYTNTKLKQVIDLYIEKFGAEDLFKEVV